MADSYHVVAGRFSLFQEPDQRLKIFEYTDGPDGTRQAAEHQVFYGDMLLQVIDALARKVDQLQTTIDNRPAINAGLPETYIRWSQKIMETEAREILTEQVGVNLGEKK